MGYSHQRMLACVFLLLLQLPAAGQSERTVRISLQATDHFTQQPLQNARAVLYQHGEELTSVYTDAQGEAVIVHTITGMPPMHPSAPAFTVGHSHPNPFASETRVPLYLSQPQSIQARIIGPDGRLVASKKRHVAQGWHHLDLNLGHLANGVYFLLIRGEEQHHIRLLKTGEVVGAAAQTIRFSPGKQPLSDAAQPGKENEKLEKQAGLEYALEVTKDRYTTQSSMLSMAGDTTLQFPLKRLNQVVFTTSDEEGEPAQTELLVSGDYFNMTITTPDTLWMHAGTYQITCEEDFVKAFRKEKQIAATDTAFHFEMEKTEAMVFFNDDPDSDMLFVAEHEDGFAIYYHGLRGQPDPDTAEKTGKWYGEEGIRVAYLTITHRDDGSESVLIFNEDFYPIRWITDYYNYSARRLPGQDTFNPRRVPFTAITEPWEEEDALYTGHTSDTEAESKKPFFAHASPPAVWEVAHASNVSHFAKASRSREDTATLDIRVGNLRSLLAWAEAETNETWQLVRWFLNEYEDNFDIIRERARTPGQEQDLYVRMAIGFTALASARTFTEASRIEYDKLPFSHRRWPKPPPKRNPVSIARGMLSCAAQAEVHRRNTDRSGVVVRVLVCRGASAYEGICQNTFFISTAISCLVRCPVTLDCFVDICAPDVLNIQKALEVAESP